MTALHSEKSSVGMKLMGKFLQLTKRKLKTVIAFLLFIYLFIIIYGLIQRPNTLHTTYTTMKFSEVRTREGFENGIEDSSEETRGFRGGERNKSKSPTSLNVWKIMASYYKPECLARIALKGEDKPRPEEDIDFLFTEEGKQYKKILGWKSGYEDPTFGLGYGYKSFQRACCREQRCYFTTTRDDPRLPSTDFDAIIFHYRTFEFNDLPEKRSEHQRWVFFELEPAAYVFQPISSANHIFNWTMTYRRDADIFFGYGYSIPKQDLFGSTQQMERVWRKNSHLLKHPLKKKKKLVAWMVSNCETLSKREDLGRALQEYISIDIYGSCGDLVCSKENWNNCLEMIERNYKFYLSFENSICQDYITEKFFSILKLNVVPVVLGFGDYEAMAPPHSYIDARDFESPKALAEYLVYLNDNQTAYDEYLAWKKNYVVLTHLILNFCSLCSKLHSDTEKKTYHSLSKWFLQDSQCEESIIPASFL